MKLKLSATLFLVALANPASQALAAPTFVNGLVLPGAMLDASGGKEANTGRMGYFSDIYYDVNRGEWWALSDRGPGGGFVPYEPRVSRFTIDIDLTTGAISNFKVAETIKFTNAGQPMTGLAPKAHVAGVGNSIDPEGLVVLPGSGNFLVSDEYGPTVFEFNRKGELVRNYTTPANIVPRNAATNETNFAGDEGNTAGRRSNRGFEGLAIAPDGKSAYAILQSALLDDGGRNGTFVRIVKFDCDPKSENYGKASAQYAYEMKRANQGQGISALVALSDHEFLVLERNNRGIGIDATLQGAEKEVCRIDLAGATDVSTINLASGTFTPVKKSPWLDLAVDKLKDLDNQCPEKWEGLSIGPKLADGSHLVLAGTDNDYSVSQTGEDFQYDIYVRLSDADPLANAIRVSVDKKVGVPKDGTYQLIPAVLKAYRASDADLAGYVSPAGRAPTTMPTPPIR